jgi:hypothetical protein
LFSLLKISDSLKSQSFKGAKKVWLFLNPAKAPAGVRLAPSYVTEPISAVWATAEPEFTGMYRKEGGKLIPIMTDPLVRFSATLTINLGGSYGEYGSVWADKDWLEANYEDVWNNYQVSSSGEGIGNVLTRYALFGFDGLSAEVSGSARESTTFVDAEGFASTQYLLVLQLELVMTAGVSEASPLVTRIMADYRAVSEGCSTGNDESTTYICTTTGTANQIETARALRNGVLAGIHDSSVWLDVSGYAGGGGLWGASIGTYLLRVDALRSSTTFSAREADGSRKRDPKHPRVLVTEDDEKIKYVTSIIDTGSEQESCDFWCALVMITIIIVAIVLAVPSGGTSLTLVAVAKIVVAVYIASLIAAAVAGATGNYALAARAGAFAQQIGPLAKLAMLIIAWDSGGQLFDAVSAEAEAAVAAKVVATTYGAESAAMMGAEEIAMRAGEIAIEDIAMEMMASTIPNHVANYFMKAMDFSSISLERVANVAGTLMGSWQKVQMDDIHKELKAEQTKAAELRQSLENDRDEDMTIAFIASMYNSLGLNDSVFDMDSMYEPSSTNVQSCYVQAMMGDGAKTFEGYAAF